MLAGQHSVEFYEGWFSSSEGRLLLTQRMLSGWSSFAWPCPLCRIGQHWCTAEFTSGLCNFPLQQSQVYKPSLYDVCGVRRAVVGVSFKFRFCSLWVFWALADCRFCTVWVLKEILSILGTLLFGLWNWCSGEEARFVGLRSNAKGEVSVVCLKADACSG